MLTTLAIMGATAIGGAFVATWDSGESETQETPNHVAHDEGFGSGDLLLDLNSDWHLSEEVAEADLDAVTDFEPYPYIDGFNPEEDVLEILLDAGQVPPEFSDIDLIWHPDFMETEIVIPNGLDAPDHVFLSGVEPSDLCASNIAFVADT